MTSQMIKFLVISTAVLMLSFAILFVLGFFSNLGFHGSIAAALGICLTVVVAVGLMALLFHSNRSAHDRSVHDAGIRKLLNRDRN